MKIKFDLFPGNKSFYHGGTDLLCQQEDDRGGNGHARHADERPLDRSVGVACAQLNDLAGDEGYNDLQALQAK